MSNFSPCQRNIFRETPVTGLPQLIQPDLLWTRPAVSPKPICRCLFCARHPPHPARDFPEDIQSEVLSSATTTHRKALLVRSAKRVSDQPQAPAPLSSPAFPRTSNWSVQVGARFSKTDPQLHPAFLICVSEVPSLHCLWHLPQGVMVVCFGICFRH